jgi:hypothetical protein
MGASGMNSDFSFFSATLILMTLCFLAGSWFAWAVLP